MNTQQFVNPLYSYFICIFLPDLNECEDNTTCDPLATCTNTEGSYVCLCDDGYTGNGTYCTGQKWKGGGYCFVCVSVLVVV